MNKFDWFMLILSALFPVALFITFFILMLFANVGN